MAIGNPASTAPLVGIYNTDQMPSLAFQAGATLSGVVVTPNPFAFVNSNITATVGTTITGAQISGALMTRTGPTANFTDTTDTAANIITALNAVGGVPVGFSYEFFIKNQTAFLQTLAGGTGVTISGGSVIPANTASLYIVTPTSSTAVTLTLLTNNSNIGSLPLTQYNALTNTTGFALTGAQQAGSQSTYINLTGTLGGAANVQSATAAQIVAAIPNAVVGVSYCLRIINSSSANFAWTVTTNTGITLSGTMSIAQNTWRDFTVTLTSLTAVTIQTVGTGTFS